MIINIIIKGNFNYKRSNLTSLKDGRKNFNYSFNKLTNIKGIVKEIGGDFICDGNPNLNKKKGKTNGNFKF